MSSPDEVAAEALRDELRARAAFADLIHLPPTAFRTAVEGDPALRTEAMARLILDYCDDTYESMPPEHALDYLHAADAATLGGAPHLQLRVAKDFANTFRFLGRFREAEASLRVAERLIGCTFAQPIHEAVVEFGWLALYDDIGQPVDFEMRVESLIRAFEREGAADRAFVVRLYDAVMKFRRGDHLAALAAYEDAGQRAIARGSDEDLARAHFNRAQCYRALGDCATARVQFAEAADVLHRLGLTVLEARALRCAARMSIRMYGEAAIAEMEAPRNTFLALGLAGEACRTTLAIIEELVLHDRRANLAPLVRQLEEEIASLGLSTAAAGAMRRLREAVRDNRLSDEILDETWNAFGPTYGLNTVSAMEMVRN